MTQYLSSIDSSLAVKLKPSSAKSTNPEASQMDEHNLESKNNSRYITLYETVVMESVVGISI